MSEIIASGKIVDTEDLIVTATVSVEEVTDESAESGETKYSVYMNVKKYKADEMPAEPLTFDTVVEMVAEAGGEMAVPAVEGEEKVAIEAPTAIRYAKTKAFEGDEGICIFGSLRYEY